MKVMVVGGGGREHALIKKIKEYDVVTRFKIVVIVELANDKHCDNSKHYCKVPLHRLAHSSYSIFAFYERNS